LNYFNKKFKNKKNTWQGERQAIKVVQGLRLYEDQNPFLFHIVASLLLLHPIKLMCVAFR
jgi:hypothetical protein